MRWKTRPIPAPRHGDVRKRHRFAWRPLDIDGITVWLEFYRVEEHFFVPLNGPGKWTHTRTSTLDYY